MTPSPAAFSLSKLFRLRYYQIQSIIWPLLICFFSITLFLFLSYMIIEGYSIIQMVQKERNVTVMRVIED